MIRIDARTAGPIRDIVLALNAMDRTLAKQIRKENKRVITPEWKEALAAESTTVPQALVLVATSTVATSDRNVRLTAATKGKPLSGGASPKIDYAAFEFGTKKRGHYKKYRGRRGAKTFDVNRRTSNQLKSYQGTGYVFYPAVKRFVPRAAALWAQTTVRALAEALEGKRG